MVIVNKQLFFGVGVVACFLVVLSLNWLSVETENRLVEHLVKETTPFTQYSFTTLLSNHEYMRSNGRFTTRFCRLEQNETNPWHLATFTPTDAETNERIHPRLELYRIEADYDDLVEMHPLVSYHYYESEQITVPVTYHIKQENLPAIVGYIESFCMKFSGSSSKGMLYLSGA